jgi:UDP-glucose 4-epimerase
VVDAPHRDCDPARLVANSVAARKALGWQPVRDDLATIIEDAWKWEEKTASQPSYA